MIVVDASAALAALLNDGPARSALSTEQLHSPHLVDSEVANGLRRLLASSRIGADAAGAAIRAWRRLGLVRYPVVGMLGRVWELRDNLSAYDASYVALAEELRCALVSADRRLARAPGVRCSVTLVPR